MSPASPSTSRHAFAVALPEDKALLERLEKKNEEELQRLEKKLEEAEKTEGETEISDLLKAKATYLTRIGDKVCADHLRVDSNN